MTFSSKRRRLRVHASHPCHPYALFLNKFPISTEEQSSFSPTSLACQPAPVPPGRVHRDFQWQFCQVDANPEPHAPQHAATADDFGAHRSGWRCVREDGRARSMRECSLGGRLLIRNLVLFLCVLIYLTRVKSAKARAPSPN